MSEPVDYVPFETTTTAPAGGGPASPAASAAAELERLYDVPVELAVEIGRTRMTIRETLALGPGSIVTLDRLSGEPVDLLVNGKRIARGEVVVIDEEFGLRVTEVVAGEAGEDESAPAPAAGAAPHPPAAAPEPEPEPAVAAEPAEPGLDPVTAG
jgi:flagellar motor switch protein FliN/FliY